MNQITGEIVSLARIFQVDRLLYAAVEIAPRKTLLFILQEKESESIWTRRCEIVRIILSTTAHYCIHIVIHVGTR